MIFFISLGLALIFIFSCKKALLKNPGYFYFAAVIIAITIIVLEGFHVHMSNFTANWIWSVFARGGLQGALFIIVMVTGAFPNGSAPVKLLMPIRGQLSILASILTLGHNIAYGKIYFVSLFTEPSILPLSQLLAAVCSLLMLLIMLPLWITSFRCIRKKMSAKHWKQLQRLAYGFYGLLFCHVLLLTIPNALKGKNGYWLTVFVYSIIFLSYAVCRILKAIAIRKKTMAILWKRQKIASLCCITMVTGMVLTLYFREENQAKDFETETEAVYQEISETSSVYMDGTYEGTAFGNNGELTVLVTIENNVMTNITVASHHEDKPYITDAIEKVIPEILAKNSTQLDTVSGATFSSGGIIDAVAAALEQAKSKP